MSGEWEKFMHDSKMIILNFIYFCKMLIFKFKGKKIYAINEAAGLGDYLWVQSYFPIIKEQKKCRILFFTTARNLNFVEKYSNGVDIVLPIRNPYKPKIFETWLLIFFTFDCFINFRSGDKNWEKLSLKVRAKKIIREVNDSVSFYDKRNNATMSQILEMPRGFTHSLRVINYGFSITNYVLFCPIGCSLRLSNHQIQQIIKIINRTRPSLHVVLCGWKTSDSTLLMDECGRSKLKVFDGLGLFPQWALPSVVNSACGIICVNTSIYHMAVLLEKKCLCFSRKTPGAIRANQKGITTIIADSEKDINVEPPLEHFLAQL